MKNVYKKAKYPIFPAECPAISVASPLHWCKKQREKVLPATSQGNSQFKSNLYGLSATGKSRLAVESGLGQDAGSHKADFRAITNEQVWGHSENKVWRTGHFSQREGPSMQFFSEQRPASFLA